MGYIDLYLCHSHQASASVPSKPIDATAAAAAATAAATDAVAASDAATDADAWCELVLRQLHETPGEQIEGTAGWGRGMDGVG